MPKFDEDKINEMVTPQLSMFREFYGRDKSDSSNLFLDWDLHPVYIMTLREQIKLKKKNDKLKMLTHEYQVGDSNFEITITPAHIKNNNGEEEVCYPTENEELVEFALRKLMTRKNSVLHNPGDKQTVLVFTLNEVRDVLEESGHARDTNTIAKSINILRRTAITIKKDGGLAYDGNILLEAFTMNRQEYIENGVSQCAVSFNSIITSDLNNLNYRQINSFTFMQTKMALSRKIIKLLIINFKNAGFDAPAFVLKATEVINTSSLKYYSRPSDKYKAIREALDEIRKLKTSSEPKVSAYINEKDSGDLEMIKEVQIKKGNKILEIEFHITPSKAFIDYCKASNKRTSDQKSKLQQLLN